MATKFISLPELAQVLGLPVTWLRRAAREGKLPHLLVGRRLMFDPAAVEQVLAQFDSLGGRRPGESTERELP